MVKEFLYNVINESYYSVVSIGGLFAVRSC